MARFKIPPVSTLIGTSFINYAKTLQGKKISLRYVHKIIISGLIIILSIPLRWWEFIYFSNKLKKNKLNEPPIFILGHWRSGTTYLHNLLCQDTRAGYVTTYQALFPESLGSKWLFKTFMKTNMPDKRPSDNVKLSVEFPQEDEFALGNMNPYCFYHFFHFPYDYKEYYQKYIQFQISEKKINRWGNDYERLIKKALINTDKERIILKNPANTGRIKRLITMYPEAKFIFIYRNPLIVYLSTKKFFLNLFPTLQFQEIEQGQITTMILDLFERFIKDYDKYKYLIPKTQLIEVRFDDLEATPLLEIEKIYTTLKIDGFEEAKYLIQTFIQSNKNYEKNKYRITKKEMKLVLEKWSFAMKNWNYGIPENIEVVDVNTFTS